MRFKKLLALIIISTFLLTGCKNDKKYNEYMEEGQQAVKQEQYEDALDYFESALTEKDGDTEATSLHTQVEKILQVEAKIKNKLYDEAIELCNEIIKSDSESSVCRDVAQSLKSQCEKLKEEQEKVEDNKEINNNILKQQQLEVPVETKEVPLEEPTSNKEEEKIPVVNDYYLLLVRSL